jgi:hypothetical protein
LKGGPKDEYKISSVLDISFPFTAYDLATIWRTFKTQRNIISVLHEGLNGKATEAI